MYHVYTKARSGPSSADAAALQALYGVRQADPYEGSAGNDATARATPLSLLSSLSLLNGATNNAPVVAQGDITTLNDRDTYSFNAAPNASTPFDVTLKAQGVSLLNAKVTVLDALAQPVASAVALDPLNNDLAITIGNPVPGGLFRAGRDRPPERLRDRRISPVRARRYRAIRSAATCWEAIPSPRQR